MHELSITESILNIALRKANEVEAKKITDITLVIGDLSTFVDESVQFYWDIISDGTIAKGAHLEFRRIPAKLHCHDCDLDYTPKKGELLCPQCGGARVEVIEGEEFYLDSIGVET